MGSGPRQSLQLPDGIPSRRREDFQIDSKDDGTIQSWNMFRPVFLLQGLFRLASVSFGLNHLTRSYID